MRAQRYNAIEALPATAGAVWVKRRLMLLLLLLLVLAFRQRCITDVRRISNMRTGTFGYARGSTPRTSSTRLAFGNSLKPAATLTYKVVSRTAATVELIHELIGHNWTAGQRRPLLASDPNSQGPRLRRLGSHIRYVHGESVPFKQVWL